MLSCYLTAVQKQAVWPSLLFQGEVAEHVVSYQPGAKASSDFATFPVTSFTKVLL